MGWIRVKDRLPKDRQMIAVCVDRMQTGCVCRYCEDDPKHLACLTGELRVLGFTWEDITHWMPLPQPPKGEHE